MCCSQNSNNGKTDEIVFFSYLDFHHNLLRGFIFLTRELIIYAFFHFFFPLSFSFAVIGYGIGNVSQLGKFNLNFTADPKNKATKFKQFMSMFNKLCSFTGTDLKILSPNSGKCDIPYQTKISKKNRMILV